MMDQGCLSNPSGQCLPVEEHADGPAVLSLSGHSVPADAKPMVARSRPVTVLLADSLPQDTENPCSFPQPSENSRTAPDADRQGSLLLTGDRGAHMLSAGLTCTLGC